MEEEKELKLMYVVVITIYSFTQEIGSINIDKKIDHDLYWFDSYNEAERFLHEVLQTQRYVDHYPGYVTGRIEVAYREA